MHARLPIVVVLVLTAALATRAQRSGFTINEVGLPAIDTGMVLMGRAPSTAAAERRASIEAAIRGQASDAGMAQAAAGRVIVKFQSDAATARRTAAVRAVAPGAIIAARPSYADFDIIRIGSDEDPEAVAAALRAQHPDVIASAQAAYRWQTMLTPNDPLYATRQWNLPFLNLEPAWDIQPAAGSSITVAVIDSGMAYQHATLTAFLPAFRLEPGGPIFPSLGNVAIPYAAASQLVSATTQGRIVAPYDFIWERNSPFDFDGHGTHVSGTIGQITNDSTGTAGVAFNVKLMPVKVIDGIWDILFGAPNEATDDVVARGIRYAVDSGARVLNMSIGRAGPPSFVVEDAIRYAVGRGAFVAVAAGNSYESGNPQQVLAEICNRVNGAVSVAAIDRNKGHASYSTAGNYVELAAPGGDGRTPGFSGIDSFVVQQTFNFFETDTFDFPPYRAPRFDIFAYVGYAGTSMATPHVAGAAAILMQQGITNPAAIEDALKRTAVDLGAAGRDNFFGHGLINVRNAMFGIGAAK
jgi:serine protease